jgi:hypothetical protein
MRRKEAKEAIQAIGKAAAGPLNDTSKQLSPISMLRMF